MLKILKHLTEINELAAANVHRPEYAREIAEQINSWAAESATRKTALDKAQAELQALQGNRNQLDSRLIEDKRSVLDRNRAMLDEVLAHDAVDVPELAVSAERNRQTLRMLADASSLLSLDRIPRQNVIVREAALFLAESEKQLAFHRSLGSKFQLFVVMGQLAQLQGPGFEISDTAQGLELQRRAISAANAVQDAKDELQKARAVVAENAIRVSQIGL